MLNQKQQKGFGLILVNDADLSFYLPATLLCIGAKGHLRYEDVHRVLHLVELQEFSYDFGTEQTVIIADDLLGDSCCQLRLL